MIGYDVAAGELYGDRSRSGNIGLHRDSPGIQRAPLTAKTGKLSCGSWSTGPRSKPRPTTARE